VNASPLAAIAPPSTRTFSDACAPWAIILPFRMFKSLRITITCFA
jgi:hypothetical protein